MSYILGWVMDAIQINVCWMVVGTIASIIPGLLFFVYYPRPPWLPMIFPTTGFEIIDESDMLEEEMNEEFLAGRYYPMDIRDILMSKYQVVGKLGLELHLPYG